MAYRLFEGKEHASIYQKYRFTPPEEVKEIILQYLDNKRARPHLLAVDLGCGTGQNSRLLAPHFQEVVGMDVSQWQLEEARAVPGFANITYREGTAEELPFPDGSVDLLTAASAAHWFDRRRFLAEASRVLKPRGCVALLGYTDHNFRFCYRTCGETLAHIFNQVKEVLLPYTSSQVSVANSKLEELFSAVPFPDKERVECVPVRRVVSVRNLLGFMETYSMFQTYRRTDQQAADALLLNTQNRFLEEMGVSSPDAELEVVMEYFCVLASKPE